MISANRKHHRRLLEKAHKAGKREQFELSERLYRQYLRECPTDPQACFNVGVLVQRRATDGIGYHEAAQFYQRAICSPEVDMEIKGNAMNNFGLMMTKVGRVDLALGAFQRAVLLNPENAALVSNYGDALRHMARYEEASAAYQEAIRLKPDSAEAHFASGMLAIMLGDHVRGWADYEYRFQVPTFPTKRFVSDKPLWKGEDLNGKILLLTEEQGFGDSIQFIRYAGELERRWPECEIWYYGNQLLVQLMRGAEGVSKTLARADEEGFDYHVSLMSLPHILGTTAETILAQVPYIKVKTSATAPSIFDMPGFTLIKRSDYKYSRENCGAIKATKLKNIGIVWAGSPRHGKDKWRSLEPEALQPLIDAHPECQFYSLQVGPRQDEVKRLRGVIDMAPAICAVADWTATAQVLQQLDLLISVDTACVHLAGALARPVWMLTPFSPDFRWGLTGETSPWYPTLRMFRQAKEGDWSETIQRVNEAL
jgi:tetratricopeptide (TPR) repeat protein